VPIHREGNVPSIHYVGPFDEVDVPRFQIRVKAKTPIEVSDEVAVALLRQPDNWQRVPAVPARSAAAKEA
jgi:hypothetical protein